VQRLYILWINDRFEVLQIEGLEVIAVKPSIWTCPNTGAGYNLLQEITGGMNGVVIATFKPI
jgi:hypothetical protein